MCSKLLVIELLLLFHFLTISHTWFLILFQQMSNNSGGNRSGMRAHVLRRLMDMGFRVSQMKATYCILLIFNGKIVDLELLFDHKIFLQGHSIHIKSFNCSNVYWYHERDISLSEIFLSTFPLFFRKKTRNRHLFLTIWISIVQSVSVEWLACLTIFSHEW